MASLSRKNGSPRSAGTAKDQDLEVSELRSASQKKNPRAWEHAGFVFGAKSGAKTTELTTWLTTEQTT